MSPAAFANVSLLQLLIYQLLHPAHSEVISDLADVLVPTPSIQREILDAKSKAFWKEILDAAQELKIPAHVDAYIAAERAIRQLPDANTEVREALTDALTRCRRAEATVFAQALKSSELASGHFDASLSSWPDFNSFFTGGGGGDVMRQALSYFVNGGYVERAIDHVVRRQNEILPLLRGSAEATSDVLTDTRMASKRSFDVLKYDIYNHGVPKTPEAVKAAANKLIEVSAEVRRAFTQFITRTVTEITRDFENKDTAPSAVTANFALDQADELSASSTLTEDELDI